MSRVIPFEDAKRLLDEINEVDDLESIVVMYTRKDSPHVYFSTSQKEVGNIFLWMEQLKLKLLEMIHV